MMYIHYARIVDSHSLLYNNNKTGVGSHVFGWLFTQVLAPVFDEIFIKIIAGIVGQVAQVIAPDYIISKSHHSLGLVISCGTTIEDSLNIID